MKKVLITLLVLAMVFSMASVVSADDTVIAHKVGSNPVYSIPPTITIGDNLVGESTITAENVRLPQGASVKITMSSANGFKLAYGTPKSEVVYTASKVNDDETLESITEENNVVLEIASGTVTASQKLKFEITETALAAATKSGKHTDLLTFTINQKQEVTDAEGVNDALASGADIVLTQNTQISSKATTANSGYGATGVVVDGNTFDGNGQTLTVTDANGTWDAAIAAKGGTIKNVVVSGAMRGIFMPGASSDLYIDNVEFKDVVYTFNSDAGNNNYGVYISNSVLNGWTSFSNVHKEVIFTNCEFGEGSGYAYLRAYNNCEFINCKFETGFKVQMTDTAVGKFTNCYYGDTLITNSNFVELGIFTDDTTSNNRISIN